METGQEPTVDAPVEGAPTGAVSLETAQAVLVAATQRAVEDVATGLRAIETGDDELAIPGVAFRIDFGPRPNVDPAQAAEARRARVLARGLQDCADALGVALTAAYYECVIASQPATYTAREDGGFEFVASISPETWVERIVRGGERFDRLSLPDKLAELTALGLRLPEFTESIVSLNAARNCLTHRGGIVGQRDLRRPGDVAMVVTWHRMQLLAIGADGEAREIQIPATLAGERVAVRWGPTERSFGFGQPVVFTPADFSEIAHTFLVFAQQLGAAIRTFERDRYELSIASQA